MVPIQSQSEFSLLFGERVLKYPRVQFIFHIHAYILYELYVRTSKLKIKYISRIIILSLNNRLPISYYAGNLCKASLLNYDMMLSTYNLTLNDYVVTLIY